MRSDSITETIFYYGRRDLKWILEHMPNNHRLRSKVEDLISEQIKLINEITQDSNFIPHTCVNCQVSYIKCKNYKVLNENSSICINWEWDGSFIQK